MPREYATGRCQYIFQDGELQSIMESSAYRCTILAQGIFLERRRAIMPAFPPIYMECMALTCRGMLDIANHPIVSLKFPEPPIAFPLS